MDWNSQFRYQMFLESKGMVVNLSFAEARRTAAAKSTIVLRIDDMADVSYVKCVEAAKTP